MSGVLFLGIAALICAGVFLSGLRFARMDRNPWAGKQMLGMPIEGSKFPVDHVRLIGRIQMLAAPIFFLFFAALCFGLFGPVDGIAPIRFQ